ncbi:YfhO family protein [Allomuricauda sp. SCSIO 65647]|uniref:YfhO family protein n=1 Tax=Allomuricauda sp. SCSIO 65647 TaxID=2908843 RepID=UPI001F389194|nr:YfhO family protein [Muricauda sp. SCSIO 65647]UJH67161.1 YfhO family protein [Muricauda sp. SCSIO 65647]
MKLSAKAIFTHLIVIALFLLASVVYFYPVLQGKAIYQSDIAQYKGMAKERDDFKENTGIESYWTNSAFGGMPTYQLGANYPHDYVKKLDRLIRFLPRPADYLFLYLLGFYVLMLCMKVKWRWAVLGALAFGFSTYLIIILGAGHNAKAHALGYIPFLLGGIILTFRRKYVLGFLLTALAMALEVSANHYQMTYYFMLLVLVLGLVYLIYAIREKELKHFFISVGILVGAVILGIATNATGLMATKEYADWSTRGKSALTISPDGSSKEVKDGLDYEYITQYSTGIAESMNIFIPRFFGGATIEALGEKSKTYDFWVNQGVPRRQALAFANELPLYWGEKIIEAGPAYVGAVIIFLFILGLFLVKGKHRWWLLAGFIFSLVLSWGKYFPGLSRFMIDHFPLYNKFRAVSSIQVVLELCVPVLGVLAIKRITSKKVDSKTKLKAIKYSVVTVIAIVIGVFIMKGFFDFDSFRDEIYRRNYGDALVSTIKGDREAVYINDTIRSLVFVLLTALALWFFVKDKINKNILAIALGALLLIDLVGVNLRYVNEDDFVRQRVVKSPFQPSELDQALMQDPGVFRVFDPSEGLNGARTSYFHRSLGGYHAAKPRAMQDLFEFHLYQNNLQVLNMLNVKYIIQQDEEGRSFPAVNDQANGNAWFIENIKVVKSADEAIQALGAIDTKTTAVVNTQKYPRLVKTNYQVDSLAHAQLNDYRPNYLKYSTHNANDGFVVFSEMHYPHGWNAYLDGNLVEHYRVNYALRGLKVPAGEHEIEFKFEPEVVEMGSQIALGSNIALGVLLLGGLVYLFWPKGRKTED